MDGSNNRLHLNFGSNDRLALNDRTYPTTPSTFPQPVFPPNAPAQQQPQQQPQQHLHQQQQPPPPPPQQQQPQGPLPSQHQPYAAAYAPQGYFAASGPAAYSAQYPAAPQAVSNDYAHAQNGAYQARSNTPGTNDPNVGLAHQFSHQNLGGAATRSAGFGARGPTSGQRPRTAGAPGQPPAAYGYVNAPPMPSQSSSAAPYDFQQAPERNPDRYGPNSHSNQKKCSQLATDFFKDSVKRARERNQRCARRSRPRRPSPS